MIEIKSRWTSARDKEKWAARGASFVAKVKATKVVWFPPKPVESGKTAAATAKKTAKKTTNGTEKVTGAVTPQEDMKRPGRQGRDHDDPEHP